MSEIVGEELGTPDVTDFILDFDPRYEWLALILDQYLTYIGGPEYTGITDDRKYLPEEVQEIREILAALEAGDEIDIESIKNDYPLLGDYISQEYPDLTGSGTTEESGTAEETTNVLTNPNAEQLRNILIQEGYSPEDAQEYVSNAFYDLSGQGAVTLEGILSRAGYYVEGGILQPPNAYGADTNGDGVIDTAVVLRGGQEVPVYGAADVEAQIQAEQDKYNQVIGQEGWDELEDWEKNRILESAGYTPIHGDGTTDNPELDRAIADIYQDILDRDPDPEGDSYWTDIWESGSVTDQDEDGDVDYDDLRVLIEQAAQPELEQRNQETQDLISAIKDKFPTWKDLWSEVQSQLPSNPQEWGDVIRSVIEATGIDLPDSDIYGILNGGYGVTWNPGGIAGLPSGVGAIIQSGLIFVPGIPVGLPPSSTIIGSIGDIINAENPIDVLIQRAQDVFGDIVNNPSDLINTIITDELELPENIWDILIGGAAVTQEVLDWLSENGYSSESEDTTATTLGGDDEEEGEAEPSQFSPVDEDIILTDTGEIEDIFKDTTADDTADYTVTQDDSLFGDNTINADTTVDYNVYQDDPLFNASSTNTVNATDTFNPPNTSEPTSTQTNVEQSNTADTSTNYNVIQDDSLFGTGVNTADTTVNYNVYQDDPLFGTGVSTADTAINYTVTQDDPLFGFNDSVTNNNDTAVNYTVTQDNELFQESESGTSNLGGDTPYNDTTQYTAEEDLYNPTLSTNEPFAELSSGGGGAGGGSIGGSSDPSRFRKGLTYQVFDPQPIIAPSQIDFSRGLFGGSSSQINQKEPSVVATLFGDYYDLSRFS